MMLVAVVAAGAFLAGRATGRFDGRPHQHPQPRPKVSTHAMAQIASPPGIFDINTALGEGSSHAADW
jgi:hypothetical protein